MAVFSRKRVHRPPEEVESSQTVLRATQVASREVEEESVGVIYLEEVAVSIPRRRSHTR